MPFGFLHEQANYLETNYIDSLTSGLGIIKKAVGLNGMVFDFRCRCLKMSMSKYLRRKNEEYFRVRSIFYG